MALYTAASCLRLIRLSVPSPGIRMMYLSPRQVNEKERLVMPFFST